MGPFPQKTGILSDRLFAQMSTQLPTFLAARLGVTNVSTLSLIYGTSLYYIPFAFYAVAAFLFLRKSMNRQAVLLALLYLILVYFTSCFIVHESHFGTGLFVLAISIIATSTMRNIAPLLALLCIGLIALSSYGFWIVFFPVCAVFFLLKVRREYASLGIRSIQILIILLYIAGSALTGILIMVSPYQAGRDSLLTEHLIMVWPEFVAACLLYGATVLLSSPGFIARYIQSLGRLSNFRGTFSWARHPQVASVLMFCSVLAASEILYLIARPIPWHAYPLRSLQLALPLLFAGSFVHVGQTQSSRTPARAVALYALVPMLLLALQSSLYNTAKWAGFRESLWAAIQQRSGYVPVSTVPLRNDSFLWGWTSPTLSIVLQAMDGTDVHCILYNPEATWQPFGPDDISGARWLTGKLGRQLRLDYPAYR